MSIDERKNSDETKRSDADQEAELPDLAAKKVSPNEEEKVKGGLTDIQLGIVRNIRG